MQGLYRAAGWKLGTENGARVLGDKTGGQHHVVRGKAGAASHWCGGNGRFPGHRFRFQLTQYLRASPELAGQNQSDTAGGDDANCAHSTNHQ